MAFFDPLQYPVAKQFDLADVPAVFGVNQPIVLTFAAEVFEGLVKAAEGNLIGIEFRGEHGHPLAGDRGGGFEGLYLIGIQII